MAVDPSPSRTEGREETGQLLVQEAEEWSETCVETARDECTCALLYGVTWGQRGVATRQSGAAASCYVLTRTGGALVVVCSTYKMRNAAHRRFWLYAECMCGVSARTTTACGFLLVIVCGVSSVCAERTASSVCSCIHSCLMLCTRYARNGLTVA